MTAPDQAATIETLEETLQRRRQEEEEQQEQKPKRQPRYQVILWDDDEHTYAYVIVMLMELFGYPPEKGFQIAHQVDSQGRAVVCVTTKEHAELKRDQILAYGKDALIEDCNGSMWATIEPVPEE
ncbi:MAG TPA: ATP-dependent Clp protease adaptor ClpS [Thermoguttaceae bacterium]|nr:ATP-dependent Clp protease adaptor ClpS [Thermoguttaceae bacterium]